MQRSPKGCICLPSVSNLYEVNAWMLIINFQPVWEYISKVLYIWGQSIPVELIAVGTRWHSDDRPFIAIEDEYSSFPWRIPIHGVESWKISTVYISIYWCVFLLYNHNIWWWDQSSGSTLKKIFVVDEIDKYQSFKTYNAECVWSALKKVFVAYMYHLEIKLQPRTELYIVYW